MSARENEGVLYEFHRNRVGEPTTHDEVRGYWVFLTGLLLGTVGILLFIPSAAPRATIVAFATDCLSDRTTACDRVSEDLQTLL